MDVVQMHLIFIIYKYICYIYINSILTMEMCFLQQTAKARECVAVALSPTPSFNIGKTYAIHIGAANNQQTVIRRRLPNEVDAVDTTANTPHICSSEEYKPYWICLDSTGKVSVGIGSIPFQNTVAILDDSLYHVLRSGVDAIRFIGIGNSALGRKSTSLQVRNVIVSTIPLFLENAQVSMYDPSTAILSSNDDEQQMKLRKEYQSQCERAEARAKRFGVEYKQPPPDAFFKWSEARKLRSNVTKGFITGIDIMSQEEKEKARKRKERFEEEDMKNNKNVDEKEESMMEDNDPEALDEDSPQKKQEREPLSIEQAWDNEDLVSSLRMDPPCALYPTALMTANTNDNHDDMETNPSLTETKIHLFSIDWAAFKQIRTDDILAYFSVYGPTYVEWLGELSCNVHFEDKYSAARALEALSRPIPVDIPVKSESVVCDDDIKDENHSSTMEDVNVCDAPQDGVVPKPISETNLGIMGWRLCNYPIRKIQSDRFGKRGTRARCLFRIANSLDVLEERPTSWPKPPPGFTTSRVLGPGMDFKVWEREHNTRGRRRDSRGGGGGKRRRRGNDKNDDDYYHHHHQNEDDYYEASDPYNQKRYGRRKDEDEMSEDREMEHVDEFGRSTSALDRTLSASR
jgi:hypothetical protein